MKNKLGSLTSSKNYRSISISSLILKIIDWLIILLFGVSLELDDLQFSYQPNCSTTMCTWLLVETISYFLKNGSEVFSCMCDMTKAFDLVKHSVLFRKLIDKGLSLVFVRLLLAMYALQTANVRWNSKFSEEFPLSNGVKQGAVLSAILYCVYMNGLFEKLRENKIGCWIAGDYLGILGYADDNFLLSPSIEGLQSMLKTCEEYAEEHNLIFSTDPDPAKSKTKCMAFLLKERSLEKLTLCGNPLGWVNHGKHLGNKITNDISGLMKQDIIEKRAKFIARNNELCQEFYFAHPRTKLHINNVYNSHFYGSPLWDLCCQETSMISNSWNTSFRKMFDIPRDSHRYLVEAVSDSKHLWTSIVKRFLTFCDQIRKSKKIALKNVFRTIEHDTRSITGSNLRHIMIKAKKNFIKDLNPFEDGDLSFCEIPDSEKWRVGLIHEITDVKFGSSTVNGFSHEELNDILSSVCSN